ncbi:MAG: 2-oxoacid:acceptor oxidoreductase family protein [Succinivibrio sp.]
MFEILWHGRGGQGAFTAARLLGAAYSIYEDNHYALAFPSFGPERRGAPVRAFTKLSDRRIGDRSELSKADIVVFLDDTLFSQAAFDELKEKGRIILCTKQIITDPKVICIDAVTIAEQILGLPITNTVLLGAVAAVCDIVSVESVIRAIEENMHPKLQKRNIEAVREAYRQVRGE